MMMVVEVVGSEAVRIALLKERVNCGKPTTNSL